jgi:Domain of unknown function (DUF4375)
MSKKSFLDRAAEYTYKELERIGGDPTKLDIPLETVAILYTIQAIIDNGSFQYLFESNFPINPPYSAFIEAYRRIGALDAAARLQKAVAMFAFEEPHLHQQQRVKFMESLNEEHEFFQLGDEVCGDKKIWSALEDYTKKNAAFFPVAVN